LGAVGNEQQCHDDTEDAQCRRGIAGKSVHVWSPSMRGALGSRRGVELSSPGTPDAAFAMPDQVKLP
jgi:hypothetical protein